MSMTWLLKAILVGIVAVAIVGSILVFLRKKLTPKAPLAAALVGVIVTIAVVSVAAYELGLYPGAPICLVLGTFVGFVAVQPHPRETRYLLRGLALALAANLKR